jgi:hypothetical protein
LRGESPDCRTDYFRPFSCKVFYLCPSCFQKRTLLFGEYMNERLLLLLPHRQMVFTPRSGHCTDFPKVLRVFFCHDRMLYGEISNLVEVLQHLPDAGARLIRRYGLYSSRSRGTWSAKPHLTRLAPEGWKRDHQPLPAVRLGPSLQDTPDQSVSAKESRAAWARLLAKVYEVDPLCCTRCGSPMRVLAIITDPHQCLRILHHLIKTGAAPPGLDPASLN